jgi:hypothetical protein
MTLEELDKYLFLDWSMSPITPEPVMAFMLKSKICFKKVACIGDPLNTYNP